MVKALDQIEYSCLSAPFLVAATPAYLAAPIRLIVVGQQTNGWDHGGIDGPHAFASRVDAVKLLMEGYEMFAFAEGRRSGSGPFWRFHREVAANLGMTPAAIMWLNLIRCDANGASPIDTPAEQPVKNFQHQLLRKELAILDPNAVVFLTGPSYDDILADEIQPATWSAVSDHMPMRRLARLTANQPFNPLMLRTYHPSYLARSRQWGDVLEQIVALVRQVDEEWR